VVLLAAWGRTRFLVALTWAALIAIHRLADLHQVREAQSLAAVPPALAPLLFTLLTGLVLVVPILLTAHQIAQGSDAFVRRRSINCGESGIPVPVWLAQLADRRRVP